jgi:hypothetical protein
MPEAANLLYVYMYYIISPLSVSDLKPLIAAVNLPSSFLYIQPDNG